VENGVVILVAGK